MSRTRRRGLSEDSGSWNTGCTSRARSRRPRVATGAPNNRISPASGAARPSSNRAKLDLPQPDSPTMPSTAPSGTASETRSTATKWWPRLR